MESSLGPSFHGMSLPLSDPSLTSLLRYDAQANLHPVMKIAFFPSSNTSCFPSTPGGLVAGVAIVL